MQFTTSLMTYIQPRRLKSIVAFVLALLGLVIAVIAFSLTNDQVALVTEVVNSLADSPVGNAFTFLLN